jgi:hypothetical protein
MSLVATRRKVREAEMGQEPSRSGRFQAKAEGADSAWVDVRVGIHFHRPPFHTQHSLQSSVGFVFMVVCGCFALEGMDI